MATWSPAGDQASALAGAGSSTDHSAGAPSAAASSGWSSARARPSSLSTSQTSRWGSSAVPFPGRHRARSEAMAPDWSSRQPTPSSMARASTTWRPVSLGANAGSQRRSAMSTCSATVRLGPTAAASHPLVEVVPVRLQQLLDNGAGGEGFGVVMTAQQRLDRRAAHRSTLPGPAVHRLGLRHACLPWSRRHAPPPILAWRLLAGEWLVPGIHGHLPRHRATPRFVTVRFLTQCLVRRGWPRPADGEHLYSRSTMRPLHRFTVLPTVPEALAPLRTLAHNLRWSWHPATQELFRAIDPDGWEASGHNPLRMLNETRSEEHT